MTDPDVMIAWLDGRIQSTRMWLRTHGPGTKRPWPQMDIESKETNLARYEEIRVAYVKALERRQSV